MVTFAVKSSSGFPEIDLTKPLQEHEAYPHPHPGICTKIRRQLYDCDKQLQVGSFICRCSRTCTKTLRITMWRVWTCFLTWSYERRGTLGSFFSPCVWNNFESPLLAGVGLSPEPVWWPLPRRTVWPVGSGKGQLSRGASMPSPSWPMLFLYWSAEKEAFRRYYSFRSSRSSATIGLN